VFDEANAERCAGYDDSEYDKNEYDKSEYNKRREDAETSSLRLNNSVSL
jgi:hypothetical protein